MQTLNTIMILKQCNKLSLHNRCNKARMDITDNKTWLLSVTREISGLQVLTKLYTVIDYF